MAKSGKGGKGGGTKGGSTGGGGSGKKGGKGGKGKTGAGCAPGQITLCFSPAVVNLVKAAFSGAVMGTGTDGCVPGLMRVCLDPKTATQVWANLTVVLGQGGPKKKKKKGKSKGKVGSKVSGLTKTKLKGGKAGAAFASPRP